MRRTLWAGRALVAASIPVLLAATATPSHASVAATEMTLAVAETTVAIADAAVDVAAINAKNPNLTCSLPAAHGGAVTPATDGYVVAVHGLDVAVAHADCLSRTVMTYSATLTVTVQYRTLTGTWVAIPDCTGSSTLAAVDGAVALTAMTPCRYKYGDSASGRPHRAHAVLTNTVVDDEYHGYSEPWQG